MKAKKKLTQALCILSAAVMMLSVTGCGGSSSNGTGTSTENGSSSDPGSGKEAADVKKIRVEYKTEKLKLPQKVDYVDRFIATDDKIYYTTIKSDYNSETGESKSETTLNCMDLQGNLVSSDVITCEKIDPAETYAAVGNVQLMADGSMWYIETHNLYDEETGDDKGSMILKHRSASGEDLVSLNIKELPAAKEQEYGYIQGYAADSEGRIIIVYGESIIVVGADGKQLFKIDSFSDKENSWVNGVQTGGDGKVYINVYESGMNEEGRYFGGYNLKTVDFENKKLADGIQVKESSASGFTTGNAKYPLFYSNGTSLYGLNADGSGEEIINWINCGVDSSYINSVGFLGDDYLIPPGYDEGDESYFQLVRKLDESEVKEKILVTLAAYYLSESVRSAVIEFNDNSDEYAIQVKDYSSYNDYSSGDESGYNAGMTMLNSEISSGNIPDILCISDVESFDNYTKKGLMADINTFIDNDPDYKREDYCDSILRNMENAEGKLFAYPTNYYLVGFASKKKYVPNDGAVNLDDILNARKDGMSFFSQDADRKSFLQVALIFGTNTFIDKNAGTCDFNNDNFKKLLELSKEFPEEVDYQKLQEDPDYWENYDMQYRNDKTLASVFTFYNYSEINRMEQGSFGEEISLYGMPGTNAGPAIMPSTIISISASSPYGDAGWKLIKSAVSEERQSKNDWNGFPMNNAAKKKLAEKAMKPETYTDENGEEVEADNTYWLGDQEIKIDLPTQDDIDRIDNLANETGTVILGLQQEVADIIYEEATNYYNGQNTVDQTAEMIQSRVQLYMSEQS